MPLLAAVYGFEITRPIVVGSLRIVPITDSYEQARTLARDLGAYHLTATIEGTALPDDERFKLEGVLCFIEHLDVIIIPTVQFSDSGAEGIKNIPPTLRSQRRNNGGGAVIGEDTFFRESRTKFVNLAMVKLNDTAFCESTKFKQLLFKCIETFRQRSPFLEITYFLLYSGLESFARSTLSDTTTRNSSKPIHKVLAAYGFSVLLDDPTNLPRSIATYTRLRNSLFHNSEFQTHVQLAGAPVLLDASAYLFHLSMLVSLTVLKAVGFDDGHTNWDAWISSQLHC